METASAAAASMSDPGSTRPGAAIRALALFAFATLVVLRAPQLLLSPRFSAEEGSVYFQSALENGFWATLFSPHMDYLVLYENAAVLVAARVPLEHAPLVTTLAALALQLIAPALILTSRSAVWAAPWRRFTGLALLLVVQPSAPVWLTTNTAAFHCAVTAFLILLEPTGALGAQRRLTLRGLLAFCGLTGPVAAFLLPAFMYRAWTRRDRESRIHAGISGICTVVQVVALVVSRMRPGGLHRELVVDAGTTGFAALTRAVLQPTLGIGAAAEIAVWSDRLGDVVFQSAGVLIGVVGALVLFRLAERDTELRVHGLALVGVIVPTLLFATGSTLDDTRRVLVHPLVHDRYVYAPAVIVVTLALRQAATGSLPRLAALVLVAAALVNGVVNYRSSMGPFVDGQPDWSAEVERHRRTGTRTLRVWPARFTVRLPAAGRTALAR